MNNINIALTLLFLGLSFPLKLAAIEESIYQVNGSDPEAKTLEKLGGPKGAKLPVSFKKGGVSIKVEILPSKHLSVDFTPPHSFTISDADLFERIETSSPHDIMDAKLLIADPKTGRIFHLSRELKVSKMDILKPWPSKANLRTLKEILEEMNSSSKKMMEKSK